jgi:F-type H+-transporting ATPase subunit gamma
MASTRIIKRRIKSAKNIAQITKAMQMVAASKMKKAQSQAINTRPYAAELLMAVNSLKGKVDPAQHPLLTASEAEIKEAVVLIAPDKGLCGGLVTNLSRLLLEKSKNSSFIVLGKKGRDAVLRLGFNIEAYFDLGISQPKYEIVPPVAEIIIAGFITGKFSKVSVVYTKFINTLSQKPITETILPLSLEIFVDQKEESFKEYLFEPSASSVLDALLPHYVEMELYQIILESYASEQSARMMAMKNASDNAKDIIGELTLSYNKIRQSLITNEIADIATAAMTVGKN